MAMRRLRVLLAERKLSASRGARDYLLEGFMDERTVRRVLQTTVANMDESDWWQKKDVKAGEACRCSPQAKAPEHTTQQSVRPVVLQKQEELVRMLKRNLRASDQIVPSRYGQIELVLRNAKQSCVEKVVRRLLTRMDMRQLAILPDAPFVITVVSGEGVEVTQALICRQSGEFALEIGERP
jgi:hypothetical protein